MSRKINFTKEILDSLVLPLEGQRLVLHDTQVVGLQCRVTSNGVKTFSVFKRIKNGSPERVTLGKYPLLTIKNARTEAVKVLAVIASGGNAAQMLRIKKAELTFGDLFNEYLEKHAKIKKRSWKSNVGIYNLYLKKPLEKKRISEIYRSDIALIHSDISSQYKNYKDKNAVKKLKSGNTSNRVLALISSIFGWAINMGLCDTNPARGIKRNPEISRERFLQTDEMPRFFKALYEEPNKDIRDFLLIALLTGARKTNVITMKWKDVSFERSEWRIPLTKNSNQQTVHLVDEALKILIERKENSISDYVFPGEGKAGHLVEPKKGWKRILEKANIQGLWIHDLRRTLGSWQAKTGASLIVVGKSLGHKSQRSTAVYARLDLEPVRISVDTAVDAILRAGGVKKDRIKDENFELNYKFNANYNYSSHFSFFTNIEI